MDKGTIIYLIILGVFLLVRFIGKQAKSQVKHAEEDEAEQNEANVQVKKPPVSDAWQEILRELSGVVDVPVVAPKPVYVNEAELEDVRMQENKVIVEAASSEVIVSEVDTFYADRAAQQTSAGKEKFANRHQKDAILVEDIVEEEPFELDFQNTDEIKKAFIMSEVLTAKY